MSPLSTADTHASARPEYAAGGRWARPFALAVLLLAFALRAYHLDYQSFWSDEGISVLRSGLPLGEMLRQMPVEHVPGYFVLLHAWLPFTGENDFALRFSSLWPSVLAVALVYRLTLDLGKGTPADESRPSTPHLAALGAALLLTTASFQIWYAQELRMYSWLLAASLASTLFLWRLLLRPPEPMLPWITMGYALATALTVYLHFYGFLVPLAQTVFMLGWVIASLDLRTFGYWVASGVAVVLLFVPWLPRALAITEFGGWREAGDPWQIPWRYLSAYTVGDAMPAPWHGWLPWLYLALLAVGAWAWWRRRTAALFLLSHLLVPLAAVLWMALRNPDFHERYLIAVTGPTVILLAGSVGLGGRRVPGIHRQTLLRGAMALLLLALIATNWLSLDRLYHDESLHKPDFRGAAAWIAQHEREGDVILVDGPDPEKVFLHYYDGGAAVHDLRPLLDADGETINAALSEATTGANRAWELLYFHPPGAVQHWMATRAWAAAPSDFNGIRVTPYGLPFEPAHTAGIDVPFGDALVLEGAELSHGARTNNAPSAGELLSVTTHWQVLSPAPDYKFSLRLLDGAGTPVLADDYVPANWFAPTGTWPVGAAVDRRALLLPGNLAPGTYALTLRLYDPSNGVAVETEAGVDVTLGEVVVE